LVIDGASRETIAITEDIDDEDVTYTEDGYTEDYNEIVIWKGENNDSV